MKKRILIVLSVIFALGTFLGCANGQSGGENAGQQTTQQSANAGETGKTKEAAPLTLKMVLGNNPTQPIQQDAPSIREILKRTNVQLVLEPVPGSNYNDKKSALIATNNIPDIIQVDSKDIQEYAHTGIFLPISDYMEHMPNFSKLIKDRPEVNTLKVDGKLYGFPVLEKFRIGVAPQPMIRTDLLKKHNLQIPKTFDELYLVLKALKEAYPDSIPFTGRNGTLYMLGQLAFPMDAGGFPGFTRNPMYYEPDEQKYLYGPIQPDFKRVVEFFHKLYAEQLLDPDYAVNTQDMAFEKLSSGRSFFYYDNNTFAARIFNPALKKTDPNAGFELIEPLQNEEGQIRSYRYQRDWLGKNYAVSSKVKDPVAVVKFYDWMYSEEGTMVTNFGVEGEHYDLVDGKPALKQSLLDQYKDHQDVATAVRGAVGLGLLNIAVHVDEYWDTLVTEPYMVEMGKQIDKLTEEGKIQFMPYDPPFTKEETEKLKTLETKVNTQFEQEIDKFIMGARPLSEYDAFVQKLIDSGAKDIEQIYNDALQRLNQQ